LEGWGEKLLTLLQRFAVENILVVVTISYFGIRGSLRIGAYSHWVNITRELLTSLHEKALDLDEKEDNNAEEGEGEGEDEKLLKGKWHLLNIVDVRDKVQLKPQSSKNRGKSQRLSQRSHRRIISNGNRRYKNQQRVKINANSRIKDASSHPSVSDNEESMISLPRKTHMSPYFGNKQTFDKSQIIPRVFNFPEFSNKKGFLNNNSKKLIFNKELEILIKKVVILEFLCWDNTLYSYKIAKLMSRMCFI